MVRIVVPVGDTSAYFYVRSEKARVDPWWGDLFTFIVSSAPADMSWTLDVESKLFVSEPDLDLSAKADLVARFRTVPTPLAQKDLAIRMIRRLDEGRVNDIRVVYYSTVPV
jgi:hypothetical protein